MENKKNPKTMATSNAGISIEQTLIDLNDENVNDIPESKNITDLNTDCMAIIFMHLGLNDLLNIADSSSKFYTAACMVYKRQYGNAYMIFDRANCYR